MSKRINESLEDKLLDGLISTIVGDGFTVGIDTIIERAGIAKMTAYTHFETRVGLTGYDSGFRRDVFRPSAPCDQMSP